MAVKGKTTATKVPEGLWSKCPKCEQIVYNKELEGNGKFCPKCQYSFPLNALERVAMLLDEGTAVELDANMEPADPLDFMDGKIYKEKITANKKKTGSNDAIWSGTGKCEGVNVVLGVMNFAYMGGSMGSVVG